MRPHLTLPPLPSQPPWHNSIVYSLIYNHIRYTVLNTYSPFADIGISRLYVTTSPGIGPGPNLRTIFDGQRIYGGILISTIVMELVTVAPS